MPRPLFRLALCLLLGAVPALASPPDDLRSREELDRVVRQLDDPATEMPALGRLVRFVGIFWNEGSSMISAGDAAADALRREARRAVGAHANRGVVQRALYNEDAAARFWAVGAVPVSRTEREAWRPVLPRLEELAVHDANANLRVAAIQKLGLWDEGSAFLAGLRDTTSETDPWVLMNLLGFGGGDPGTRSRWYARAVRFLASPDEAVRARWLTAIWSNAWNPSTAPMWRIDPDPALLAALRQLGQTGTPGEQDRANEAVRLLEKATPPGAPRDAATPPAAPSP